MLLYSNYSTRVSLYTVFYSICTIYLLSKQPSTHIIVLQSGYSDIGDPNIEYRHCVSLMWYQDRIGKHIHTTMPKYQFCCGNGKVQSPLLKSSSLLLQHLLFDRDGLNRRNYQKHTRLYNVVFSFTSPRLKIDNNFERGIGPLNLRIHGQSFHGIGSMLPLPSHSSKFAPTYIYDIDNEI